MPSRIFLLLMVDILWLASLMSTRNCQFCFTFSTNLTTTSLLSAGYLTRLLSSAASLATRSATSFGPKLLCPGTHIASKWWPIDSSSLARLRLILLMLVYSLATGSSKLDFNAEVQSERKRGLDGSSTFLIYFSPNSMPFISA